MTIDSVIEEPKKIVWLAQGHEGYGVATAICNLMTAAISDGWCCQLVIMRDGNLRQTAKNAGIDCVVLDAGKPLQVKSSGLRKGIDYLCSVFKVGASAGALTRYLRTAQPDFLHVIPHMMLLPAVIAGRLTGTRIIWEMAQILSSSYPLNLNKRVYQVLCRLGRVTVLANSGYSGNSLAGMGVKPITFHLGVDASKFDAAGDPIQRQAIGLRPNAIVCAIAARLIPVKGQQMAIEALLPYFQSNTDVQLLLIGGPHEGAYFEAITQYIAAKKVQEHVIMLDHISEPMSYLRAADIIINARLTPEPFGLSIIEAMMLGKPVIATNLGGPVETVLDNVTGWLSPTATSADFSATVDRALKAQNEWQYMQEQATQHARQNFSLAAQLNRYKKALQH